MRTDLTDGTAPGGCTFVPNPRTSHYRITRFERVCRGGVTKLACALQDQADPCRETLSGYQQDLGEICGTLCDLWRKLSHADSALKRPQRPGVRNRLAQVAFLDGLLKGGCTGAHSWTWHNTWGYYWLPLVILAARNVLTLHIQQHVSSTYTAQDLCMKWVCLLSTVTAFSKTTETCARCYLSNVIWAITVSILSKTGTNEAIKLLVCVPVSYVAMFESLIIIFFISIQTIWIKTFQDVCMMLAVLFLERFLYMHCKKSGYVAHILFICQNLFPHWNINLHIMH